MMNTECKPSRGSVIVSAISRFFKLGTKAKRKRVNPPVTAAAGPVTNMSAVTMSPPPHVNHEITNPPKPSTPPPGTKRTPNDFIFGKVIGEGSFSVVYVAKDIHTSKQYAIKVCEKRHILREKKCEAIKREKDALSILSSNQLVTAPFFTKLYCTFQDTDRLYFVLTYAKNGELLPYINKVGSFDLSCTKFYSAEILHALEHLHSLGIIHRDLKPENILLDENMHILITDFGSAKILPKGCEDSRDSTTDSETQKRRHSFVGTAQYVSPELLTEKSVSRAADLWALGCIVYQMVAGLPPFRSGSEYLIFKKILKLEYEFPDGFYPSARDLVEKLLVLDSNSRLGSCDTIGYPSIRAHPFFEDVEFEMLYLQNPPPIYPYLPKNSANEELRSQYRVPDNLEPGLDDKQLTRLLGLDLQGTPTEQPVRKKKGIMDFTEAEKKMRLEQQQKDNKWHSFVEGNLILKQGLVDKRKGLFQRRRMLLLTTGPHLYYVDPSNMTLKGEIPWSKELRVEPKNFKTFFVHTPMRTYYLEDPEGYALEWVKAIEEVRIQTYGLPS